MRSHRLHPIIGITRSNSFFKLRVNRLIGYLVIVIILFFTAEAQRTQREEKEITLVLEKASCTPYQDEYEKMLYPTVRITAGFGTGSGVIIDSSSFLDVSSSKETNHKQLTTNYYYVLTACHVVDKANTVNIELYNSTIITGTVVITDTAKDLALIRTQINADFTDKIYSAKLADKDYTPYLFSPVWAVGCSLGLKPRPSQGIITSLGDLSVSAVDNWEISAPLLPGNSGGPVYDARTYEVIGIAVWVKVYDYQLITTMAGIVPINQIYELLEKVKSSK